jgi:pimeloyl-ACP methyl ester carboxylesterase
LKLPFGVVWPDDLAMRTAAWAAISIASENLRFGLSRPASRYMTLLARCATFGVILLLATGNPLVLADEKPAAEKKLPVPGEAFLVEGHTAFLITANANPAKADKPWVWYAPTLPGLPGPEERWLFNQFLDSGISIAGIDVGESYGSPAGRKLFSALHTEMVRRGFSSKPVLLGRSRGGLMTLCWAAEHPEEVGGFAGIYPVCNLASYPGLAKAAPAYGMNAAELEAHLKEHNPIDRLEPLAKAKVPLFAIHGDSDTLVPLAENSGKMKDRYAALGGTMQLVIAHGQGHNMWRGFFECHELVDFVRKNAGPNIVSPPRR